ncbi:hypothetical protein EVAR_66347_1 [Eumeta japonica]|uniref:Uncharacterized protein n=1 Tax=Eumeta variegata TaxID=151549 RepID=A0A4C2A5W2_EUMVA|nr:hypothetical protein EVAR_66347_1 [Eumeta japonica]
MFKVARERQFSDGPAPRELGAATAASSTGRATRRNATRVAAHYNDCGVVMHCAGRNRVNDMTEVLTSAGGRERVVLTDEVHVERARLPRRNHHCAKPAQSTSAAAAGSRCGMNTRRAPASGVWAREGRARGLCRAAARSALYTAPPPPRRRPARPAALRAPALPDSLFRRS